MSEDHGELPGLAHHFDSYEQQKDASTLGMWTFLVTEILFFGGLFAAYGLYRTSYPEAFRSGSHELDITLGCFNTVVLIASSLTMALAVRGGQTGRGKFAAAMLVLTMALGTVFLVVKGFEYHHKFVEHHVPGPTFHFEGPDAVHTQTEAMKLALVRGFPVTDPNVSEPKPTPSPTALGLRKPAAKAVRK